MAFTLVDVLPIAALLFILWHAVLRSRLAKTDLDNIDGPPPESFWKGEQEAVINAQAIRPLNGLLTGNFGQLFSVHGWDFHKHLAERYGRVSKIYGVLGVKQLYVFDPKALHHIIIKDQSIFEEAASFFAVNQLTFGHGLLGTYGQRHKKQRKMMNPVFSIAHMRYMIPIFYEVTHRLGNTIRSKVADGPKEIDLLQWMSRTALELIGQSGFGYSFDPLSEKGEPHRFTVAAKELVPVLYKFAIIRNALPVLLKIGPPKFRRFVADRLPGRTAKQLRDIINIIDATSVQIYENKKRAFEEGDEAVMKQVGGGKDIMSILMRANFQAAEEDRMDDSEVLGQISTFTFAAMDTTSNALSRILYLLATHSDVQEKLRQEIIRTRAKHGDVAYDDLDRMPFLDAVCRETLRLYPPVSTVQRVPRQDAVLPFSKPIRGVDGRELSEIVVPKNTNVFVSIFSVNRDPAIWGPDALDWKPERWLSPLPESVTSAGVPGVYAHLMTFIGGSRACIGFKFSQLEMKVVLSVLLSQFRFSLTQDIYWEMAPIAIPTVHGKPGKPHLPLRVELVET